MSKLSVAAAAFVSASAAGGVDQNDRPSDTSSAHLGSLPPPPHTAAAHRGGGGAAAAVAAEG